MIQMRWDKRTVLGWLGKKIIFSRKLQTLGENIICFLSLNYNLNKIITLEEIMIFFHFFYAVQINFIFALILFSNRYWFLLNGLKRFYKFYL